MKFVTVCALVVGAGAKAETLPPGTSVTAAKYKLSKEECIRLHKAGAIRISDGVQDAAPPEDEVAATASASNSGDDGAVG